jgi:glutamyl-tRNA reductase
VVCSTGCPQLILRRVQIEAVMRARRSRPLVLIDIAVPRNIDPEVQSVGNVYLHNIDDLEALVRENVRQREQELAQCRRIVDRETEAVMAKLNRKQERSHDQTKQLQPRWEFSSPVAC